MTCEQLSDAMPLVVLGQKSWTDEERRHLQVCPDCSAEWRVVSLAAGTGRNVARDLDVERVSGRVLQRLAAEPVIHHRARRIWLGAAGIAAAALLLLIIKPGGRVEGPRVQPPVAAFEIPMMELDSLSHDQLRMVLESIDEPLGTPLNVELPSMMDLDDHQLERVLRSLEG